MVVEKAPSSALWLIFISKTLYHINLAILWMVFIYLAWRYYTSRRASNSKDPLLPIFQADEIVDTKVDVFRGSKSFGHGEWHAPVKVSEMDDFEEDFWQRPG